MKISYKGFEKERKKKAEREIKKEKKKRKSLITGKDALTWLALDDMAEPRQTAFNVVSDSDQIERNS